MTSRSLTYTLYKLVKYAECKHFNKMGASLFLQDYLEGKVDIIFTNCLHSLEIQILTQSKCTNSL